MSVRVEQEHFMSEWCRRSNYECQSGVGGAIMRVRVV